MKDPSINHSDISQLISIIEHHGDINFRIEALSRLGKIKHSERETFKFLENLIVSDQEVRIRAKAAELLSKNYFPLGKNVIKWIFEHESAV